MSAHEDELVPVWTVDGHADEGTIHTWLDGAFDSASSAAVAAHVDSCAHCRELVAEARGLIAGASRMVRNLDAVPAGVVAHEDVARTASRIVAAADASRVSAVQPLKRPSRPWYSQPVMRSAAAIAVMIAGGSYVWSRTPIDERGISNDAAITESDRGAKEQPTATIQQAPAALPAAASSIAAASAPGRESAATVPPMSVTSTPLRAAAKPKARNKIASVAESKAEQIGTDAAKRTDMRAADVASTLIASTGVAAAGAVGASAATTALATAPVPTPAPAPPAAPVVALPKVAASTLPPREVSRPARVAGASVEQRANARDSSLADMKQQANMQQFVGTTAAVRRRGEDEPVPSQCWTMSGETATSSFRLPSELHLPDIAGARSYSTRWIGWPESTTALAVRMRVDTDGRLVGESVSDEQHVRLVMQRVVGGWQGTATHTIDGKRTTQRVQMKLVPDLMCNP